MNLKSSLLFSKSLIFPRTDKKSTARRSVISSIICIALSVIPLVIVLTMTNSMISGMTERIIEISSSHINVLLKRKSDFTTSNQKFTDFSNKFTKIEGITDIKKEISCEGLAVASDFRIGCQLRAVEFDKFFKNEKISSLLKFTSGNVNFSNIVKNSAVIGSQIAEKLNLKVGDSVRIIMTKKNQKGNIIPKIVNLKVSAVVSSGYQEIDSLWIFVPLNENFDIFSRESATFSVQIETENAFSPDLERIISECKSFSRPNGIVYSWKELNQSKFENFQTTKIMLYFVMILIILVASINISSAIVMLVMERRREIAILKSVGATQNGISISFVIAGAFCGISGILFGLPIGLLCSINLNEIILFFEKVINSFVRFFNLFFGNSISSEYFKLLDPAFYLTEIPIKIPFTEILLSSIFMILLSILVSLIPAIKAGKEKPLKIFNGK